jgi:hypothetical protein
MHIAQARRAKATIGRILAESEASLSRSRDRLAWPIFPDMRDERRPAARGANIFRRLARPPVMPWWSISARRASR